MRQSNLVPDGRPGRPLGSCVSQTLPDLPVAMVAAGLALAAGVEEAHADKSEPFEFANIHIETNASGCDMGIMFIFDTDGLTKGSVEDPNDQVVYSFDTVPPGMEDTHDQTEGFQERVEPQITELLSAFGCELSGEEPVISIQELFTAWPDGKYEFEGESGGVIFEGEATLSHRIPAGPEITAPDDGDVVPHDKDLLITWDPVTGSLLPSLGPITIVGYHVVVEDLTVPALPGALPAQLDVDVSEDETSVTVPKQYLEPNRMYEFEVLATEKGNNQTITEGGVFCTAPIAPADCE